MSRWTDTTAFPNLSLPASDDLLPIADVSQAVGSRQRTITWAQLQALAAAGATVEAADPGVGDDSDDGYAVGSLWYATGSSTLFVCVDATVGAADWDAISGGGGGSGVTINAQTGTTYTLVLTDADKLVTLDNGAAITLTVPTNASVAFPVGTVVAGAQLGAGLVSIAGATGVTINGVTPGDEASAGQWSTWSLTKLATDTWLASGGLA